MPTTRRVNGKGSDPNSVKMSTNTTSRQTTQTHIRPPTHSPYLPTFTESLLLAIYPTILVLGSIFSSISPSINSPANTSTYSDVHQSYQPASAAPSYFAQKSNALNVYFVKIGWFWNTLAFASILLFISRGRLAGISAAASQSDALDRRKQDDQLRRRWQAGLRYGLATLFWILTTQWFLGPPLVDRGFALTGGVCDVASSKLKELQLQQLSGGAEDLIAKEKEKLADVVTHAACRVAGGAWKGGYDISGHVFILVLGSGMVLMEMLPYIFPLIKGFGLGRVLRTTDAGDRRVGHEVQSIGSEIAYESEEKKEQDLAVWALDTYATAFTFGIVVLSFWMLLMTSAYFHTWFEKLTGLVWSLFNLWVIYFLPRGHPRFRSIFGMPGL